jgi:hypothetical protein
MQDFLLGLLISLGPFLLPNRARNQAKHDQGDSEYGPAGYECDCLCQEKNCKHNADCQEQPIRDPVSQLYLTSFNQIRSPRAYFQRTGKHFFPRVQPGFSPGIR